MSLLARAHAAREEHTHDRYEETQDLTTADLAQVLAQQLHHHVVVLIVAAARDESHDQWTCCPHMSKNECE